MEIVLSFALVSASALIIAYVGKLTRNPNPPRWTESNALLTIIIFATIAGLAFGTAFLWAGLFNYRSLEFGGLETGLLAASIAATFFAGYLIKNIGRVKTKRGKWRTDLPPVAEQATPPAATG